MSSKSLFQKLISDENIYKAILSIDSYIYDRELMEESDLDLYYKLRDKFDYELHFMGKDGKDPLIEEIRQIIKDVTDDNIMKHFFKARVCFKIKQVNKGSYRPLHMVSLKELIAIVAMLQVLIFDLEYRAQQEEGQIKLSNLSKLIPSNFYGNIPSGLPEQLFQPWQKKYGQYIEEANNRFAEYSHSEKFKFEVTLDLENFYPSINPLLVYNFIIKNLSARFVGEDLELIKKITFKLLYLELETFTDKDSQTLQELYYTDSGKNKGFQAIVIERENKFIYLTKGLPQGPPQSYFFGNLIMIEISKIYNNHFAGEALYYVDDSFIYTNEYIDMNIFKEKLNSINKELEIYSTSCCNPTHELGDSRFSGEFEQFQDVINLNADKYIIKVHESSKSSYLDVKEKRTGYIYLRFLSRLASMAAFSLKTTFSDFEEVQLKERFSTLVKAIDKELDYHSNVIQKDKGCKTETLKNYYKHCIKCDKNCEEFDEYREYFEKLMRFKRFFQYRVFAIEVKKSNKNIKDIINELEDLKVDDIQDKLENDLYEIKLNIVVQYLHTVNDDWCFSDTFYKYEENEKIGSDIIEGLINKIKDFEKDCFEKNNKVKGSIDGCYDHFYYYRAVNNKNIGLLKHPNQYKSIYKIISTKINLRNKHYKYQKNYLEKILCLIQNDIFIERVFKNLSKNHISNNLNANLYIYWSRRSKYLKRYIINTIFSITLDIELNNSFSIVRKNRIPINYFDLRLMVAARNKNIDLQLIEKILKTYIKKGRDRVVDHTIFQVFHYFKIFVRNPVYIDNLILIHKYTANMWENGSKYMYFYTLHNQAHAIELIKNINNILKALNFFRIKSIDFYILYMACYLHDISMVIYPDLKKFLTRDCGEANLIYMYFRDQIKARDPDGIFELHSIKEILLDVYNRIDTLFENKVRNNHAENSAKHIRKSKQLSFINESILDLVADVSCSHCADARDIYYMKSSAQNRLISKKFIKILLRLADLLDMRDNRVSLTMFNNNKMYMSDTNRFHWISHFITGNYKIKNTYIIKELDSNTGLEKQSYLKQNMIKEIITFEIDINLNQLTVIENKNKCRLVTLDSLDSTDGLGDELMLTINGSEKKCGQEYCNFICKWFNEKNYYFISELFYLQNYLKQAQNYFDTSFAICLKLIDSNELTTKDFDDLQDYIKRENE